jgi:hypothetical protein
MIFLYLILCAFLIAVAVLLTMTIGFIIIAIPVVVFKDIVKSFQL